jgi:hypothetical protein
MATRIVALFNLKPGVSAAAYEEWAKTTDMPTVKGLKSIDDFDVLRSTAVLGSEDKPPYQYIEIIDVNDMGAFGEDVASEKMQAIAAAFQGMADVTFIMTERF